MPCACSCITVETNDLDINKKTKKSNSDDSLNGGYTKPTDSIKKGQPIVDTMTKEKTTKTLKRANHYI